ncbi:Ig-like domain-containing protein [Bacillus sp. FJAT-49732]|uniref:Ig-like domain-containing protein n=1 Tax=Lederbergia citrisecunda TaxID=2833583 RepID=A0A942TL23_9BACI|nr:Ig-like domain-containing protein [Lederbergia citrisecunda]MBS4198612.1 Ig-like domain-containing protein [Lederbergia citrisecunda]
MTTYNVYRDGTKVKSGLTENAFTDSELTPNTEYSYQVSAENSFGESELSDPIKVMTNYSDPTAVDISPKNNNLDVDAIRNLSATVTPSTAKQTVNWTSSDTNIVTVDVNGKVTGISAGTATITATSTENASIKGTATVNVNEP